MTEEERAEMEAASEADKAAATDGTTPPVGAATSTTPAPSSTGATVDATTVPTAGEQTGTSLAHHSSFSSQPTPSGSSSDLTKKDQQGKDAKKVKPKLSPEQKAQLDALEAKRDEQKKARQVERI